MNRKLSQFLHDLSEFNFVDRAVSNRLHYYKMNLLNFVRHRKFGLPLGFKVEVGTACNRRCSYDIQAHWPLIKPGGILGGHDFSLPEVISAVVDFSREHKVQLSVAPPDWWIMKPS